MLLSLLQAAWALLYDAKRGKGELTQRLAQSLGGQGAWQSGPEVSFNFNLKGIDFNHITARSSYHKN